MTKKEPAAKQRESKAERNGQATPAEAMKQISKDRLESKIRTETERALGGDAESA